MGTSAVSWHQIEKGFMTSLPDKLKPKLLSVVHSELLDHPHFTEKIAVQGWFCYIRRNYPIHRGPTPGPGPPTRPPSPRRG